MSIIGDIVYYYFKDKNAHKSTTFSILCPFHDDHKPSLIIMPNVNRYACASCGAKGNVVKFVKELESRSNPDFTYADAITWIKQITGVDIKKDRNATESAKIETYSVSSGEDIFATTILHYDQLSDRNKEAYMKQLLEISNNRQWLVQNNFDTVKDVVYWSTRHDSLAIVIMDGVNLKCIKYYRAYKWDASKKCYSEERMDGKWINEHGMSFGYTSHIFDGTEPICIIEGVHDLITLTLLRINYLCLESAQTILPDTPFIRVMLKQKRILWLGDNDEPGAQCYAKNIKLIKDNCLTYKRLYWKNIEDEYVTIFKDISDFVCYFEDKSTPKEDFMMYVEKIRSILFKNFFTEIVHAKVVTTEDYNFFQPDDSSMYPLPFNMPILFYGKGSVGKTTLMLHYALELAKSNSDKKMFLWLRENPVSQTVNFAKSIIKWKYPNEDFDEIYDKFDKKVFFAHDQWRHFSLLTLNRMTRNAYAPAEFYKLRDKLKEYDILVFDPLSSFAEDLDLNNNSHFNRFFGEMQTWAIEENKCIVFLHHQTKANDVENRADRIMGASAIANHVRLAFHVGSAGSGNATVTIDKDNIGLTYRIHGILPKDKVPCKIVQILNPYNKKFADDGS
jgi:hypothetical protein